MLFKGSLKQSRSLSFPATSSLSFLSWMASEADFLLLLLFPLPAFSRIASGGSALWSVSTFQVTQMVKAFYRNMVVTIGLLTDPLVLPFQFSLPPSVLQLSPDLILCRGAWRSSFVIETSIVQCRQDRVFCGAPSFLSRANVGFGSLWPPHCCRKYFLGFLIPLPRAPHSHPPAKATFLCGSHTRLMQTHQVWFLLWNWSSSQQRSNFQMYWIATWPPLAA